MIVELDCDRVQDIEAEIILPQLFQQPVFLSLHPLGVKTYNVYQALIAINAVSAMRSGTVR